jgi:hypothetical protein
VNLIKAGTGRSAGSPKKRLLPVIAGSLVAALLVAGIVLGLFHPGRKAGWHLPVGSSTQGSEQEQLSISSAERDTTADKGQGTSAGAGTTQSPGNGADKRNELLAQQQQAAAEQAAAQQAAAQQAAAQQAAQEAAFAEKNRELEQRAAMQAAKEQQLELDRQRVQADQQRAAAAAADAERLRQEAIQRQSRPAPYSGPSSGSIVWQGEVHGTTLVTINGTASDSGQVLSGALPGVLVMVQPADAKHVGIAGTPAPSNAFRRLTLRIQGNGVLQEVIRWSIP